jgi:two-component sensor histidine kinase
MNLNTLTLSFVFSVLILTTDVLGQSDSLSLIQSMEAAEKIMGKDFPAALNLYQDINKRAFESPCTTCRQRSVILLGKAFWINGQYDTAVYLLKQGMGYAQRSGDLNQLASVANMIALNFYYQAYYDSAISYFQQSYTFYDTLHDKAGMARVLSNISLMYHRKGDYHKTVEYLLRGEELNDKLMDEPRSIGDFPGMENVFPDSVYFREEIADNLRSLHVHLKNGDLHAANTNYLNLAVAYNQVKEYLTAARYYVKVYSGLEKSGLRPYWDNVAVNYREVNMKDSCFYFHEKARQDFGRATQLSILSTYELLGDSHFHFEQYDSALYNYVIAMQMNMKCNNRITIAGLHRKMADVYQKQGRLTEAEAHIQNGIVLAKEVSITHQRNLLKSAAVLYSQKGDHRKAFHFQTRYANLTDSLSKVETALTLTRLLAQYKTSKKERELVGLKIEHEKNESVLKSRTITMMSLAGVTLASFVFLVVFVRQRNKIKKKNFALDYANREQEALLREIHHRVKNNLQIISSLINLKAVKASQETSEILYQLNGRIFSMGLIHERLYQKNEFQRIALDTYLAELSRYILDSFEEKHGDVELNIACEKSQIDVDSALTCGLILNELLTNSLKYAFSDQQKDRKITLALSKSPEAYQLTVADNGKGKELPENFKQTFGLRFVDQLIKSKLNGDWSIEAKNGFCAIIKFPALNISHE